MKRQSKKNARAETADTPIRQRRFAHPACTVDQPTASGVRS